MRNNLQFPFSTLSNHLCLVFSCVFFMCTAASAQPAIKGIFPVHGAVGTTVSIEGTNFSNIPANNIVYFGATKAAVTAATDSTLDVIVPNGADNHLLSVTVNGLTGYANRCFTVTFPSNNPAITNTSFKTPASFFSTALPLFVKAADLDGDGLPDIVFTNNANSPSANRISVLRNLTNAGDSLEFANEVTFPSQSAAFDMADVDGDGKLDLIAAGSNTGSVNGLISVLRNLSTPGNIQFAPAVDFSTNIPAGTGSELAVGDIDRDGKPDVVITVGSTFTSGDLHKVVIFKNSTAGSIVNFATPVSLDTDAEPEGVTLGDLDLDRMPELIVTCWGSNKVLVYKNASTAGNITFQNSIAFAANGWPRGVAVGDVTADGKPDMVVANYYSSQTVSVYQNLSTLNNLQLSPQVNFNCGPYPHSVELADMNGDGKLDIVLGKLAFGNCSILENLSNPDLGNSVLFGSRVDYNTNYGDTYTAVACDLNGDSKPELITTTHYNTPAAHGIAIFENKIPGLTPLPLRLISFNANKKNNSSWLAWSIVRQENPTKFIVQWSNTGAAFTDIGNVSGAAAENRFTFIHHNPGTGLLFYRLKLVDLDGTFSYSPIIRINTKDHSGGLNVYPNPGKDFFVVEHGQAEISDVITLTDIAGRVIKSNKVSSGSRQTILSTAGVAKGMYYLVFKGSTGAYSKLVMVQ